MTNGKIDVLVYTGPGATVESVKHCLWSLRRLLSPHYAVIPVTGDTVLKEPWQQSCALFVMPGGADLAYCRILDGRGNRLISQYVNNGGAYLGFCAGGCYGSGRCEWEVGRPSMEVVGDRELSFFPGTYRGLAFPGFAYHSEAGAKAARLQVNKSFLAQAGGSLPDTFCTYYNGGGVFVDAKKYTDRGVEVLAEYTEKIQVDGGEGQAALVYCRVGNGNVILSGPHPEFAACNLTNCKENLEYAEIVAALSADDKERVEFMKACLVKLGLRVSQTEQVVPSLSSIHLSSHDPKHLADTFTMLQNLSTRKDKRILIKAEVDTFMLEQDADISLETLGIESSVLEDSDPTDETEKVAEDDNVGNGQAQQADDNSKDDMVDHSQMTKRVVLHKTTHPESKTTPYFNHAAFFANLKLYNNRARTPNGCFGKALLYGEVVTSTNTLLEQNPSILRTLPTGLVFTATTQLAGRGRGSNVWISPPGCLMQSFIVRHPLSLSTTAPVVCIQYLAGMAVVQGIHAYDTGYDVLPIRLKWPNDIYALDPSKGKASPSSFPSRSLDSTVMSEATRSLYSKIGGVLITTSYNPAETCYMLVCGVGTNLSNSAPTTSVNQIAAKYGLEALAHEKLLASILVRFEALYEEFCVTGFTGRIKALYEKSWLHSGQIVEFGPGVSGQVNGINGSPEGNRGIVRGISSEWGNLTVAEISDESRGWSNSQENHTTGKTWELQSDCNSFDFFKGLLKIKA